MKSISDVAKMANVSVATVSKVFNGYKDISPETKDRILKIAKELDYFPNRSAAQLVSGKDDTVCVILSSFGSKTSKDEYLVGILSGVYYEAEKNNMRVVIFTAHSIINNNQNYVQFCRANNLVGLIIHGLGMDDPQIEYLVKSEVPCVFIDINITGKKTAMVSVDNEKACIEVVDKLVGLGHKEIAFVSGGFGAAIVVDRVRGYSIAMKKYGYRERIIESNFSLADAYEKVRKYVLDYPEVTAFFCASDIMAIGALNACLDLNYKVPDDISIVGYDDMSFSTYTRPKLSTVAQDFFAMGSRSTKVLLDLYNDREVSLQNYVDYSLEIRESTSKNKRA